MTRRNLIVMFLAVLCLCWMTGCAGPSVESASGQVPEARASATAPPDCAPPNHSQPDEEPGFLNRPPEEVIAALDEACEMEPFFQMTDDILLLWPEDDEVVRSSLEAFIGGWGVVLSDGTVVLNEAHFYTTYYESGQPKDVNYESLNHTATIVQGLDLPEAWRGLTIVIIAPMDEGYPYYVGMGLPRVVQDMDVPHDYVGCGLWYWQDDGYVRVFNGVDHGETFSFEPATVGITEAV